jgi:phospholipase/carboxylesterase
MMRWQLEGPRAGSARPRRLVVLLHGFGADGDDLIDIGRAWQQVLPDTAFVAPHAPEPCIMGGPGRQWFPLTFRDPAERWHGVTSAGPLLAAWLMEEATRLGIGPSQVALVGFSQGAMMALHIAPRLPQQVAAVIGYSGMLVAPHGTKVTDLAPEIGQQPPVLLVHGTQDDVIPPQALFQSAQGLAALGIPTQWHLSPGIGHGIDEEGLRHGAAFLAHAFGLE